MTLSRCSGSKPQSGEDWIGSGAFRFADDPVSHPGQTFGRLMDVVAINIGDGFEQLLDAFVSIAGRCRYRRTSAAARYQGDRSRSIVLFHPIAFPSASIAETNSAPYTDSSPVD